MIDLTILELDRADSRQVSNLIERTTWTDPSVMRACQEIIGDVRERGDRAVRDFTLRFDGVDLDEVGFAVSEQEIESSAQLEPALRDAIDRAIENVRRFHQSQVEASTQMVEVNTGIWCGERASPIESVCLYVPRGRGAFASVAYMLAVPAVLAGVPRIAMTTPPGPEGAIDPATLYVARELGIADVYRVGGAQAIAAVAQGTESIPRCAKVVGPGNVYVSAARQLLSQVIDPGPPAGPSESLILCDGTTNPRNVAWNLLIEAEHGENSTAVAVTTSRERADEIAAEIGPLFEMLTPERQAFVQEVLTRRGGIVVAPSMEDAIEFANDFAAEHVSLMVKEPWPILQRLRNAGEVLLGEYPIFSLANYAMGINAILPTGGGARTKSGVTVRDFMKLTSIGFVDRQGFEDLREIVPPISRDEGFSAHHLAVEQWETS